MDEKLQEIFGKDFTITDVFRELEKAWLKYNLVSADKELVVWSNADTSIEKYIPYNPTLPLLQQSEDTKQELIKLFS